MEKKIIDFAQWYSGMDRSKVEAAYRRYLREQPEAVSQSAVSGSLLAVRIEEALAKYWYDTEYIHIDKSDHKGAEESRKRFRKWIDDNLAAISKQ
jgi:hypothetical protein